MGELQKAFKGVTPTAKQISAAISTNELAIHCRRRTREVGDIKLQIDQLLKSMWDRTDTAEVRLINAKSMQHIWAVQEKHLPCIQDPPGVDLYTKTGTMEKGGKMLNVLRCARGSSSVESFHRHQCTFIPGEFTMHKLIYDIIFSVLFCKISYKFCTVLYTCICYAYIIYSF